MPPVLVLLPGMDGTGDMFGPLVAAMPDSVRSVVVRYPTNEPLGYPALTSLARSALPTEAPYVIVGESFSGPVAVTLAAEAPRGLVGLILCASFVASPMPWLRPARTLLRFLPIRLAVRLLGPNRLFGRFQTRMLRDLFFATAKRVPPNVLRERIRSALDIDVSSLMASVAVPVMYIQATNDALLTQGVVDKLSAVAPETTIVKIDGPHGLLQCKSAEAARVIFKWMESLLPQSSTSPK